MQSDLMMAMRMCILALAMLTLPGCDLLDNVRLHKYVADLQDTVEELQETNKSLEASLHESQNKIQLYDSYIAYTYFCDYMVPICDDADVKAGRWIIAAGHDNLTYTKLLLLSAAKSFMCAFLLIFAFTLGVAMHIYINYPDQVLLQAMKKDEASHAHKVETAQLEYERIVVASTQEQERHHQFQHQNSTLAKEIKEQQQIISRQKAEVERLTRMIEELDSL